MYNHQQTMFDLDLHKKFGNCCNQRSPSVCFAGFYNVPMQHRSYSTKDVFENANHMENNCCMKEFSMNVNCECKLVWVGINVNCRFNSDTGKLHGERWPSENLMCAYFFSCIFTLLRLLSQLGKFVFVCLSVHAFLCLRRKWVILGGFECMHDRQSLDHKSVIVTTTLCCPTALISCACVSLGQHFQMALILWPLMTQISDIVFHKHIATALILQSGHFSWM